MSINISPTSPTSITPVPTPQSTPTSQKSSTSSTSPTSPTSQKFIDSLSHKEKKAYKIAKDFLETSFDMKKSIGFKKWWATNSD